MHLSPLNIDLRYDELRQIAAHNAFNDPQQPGTSITELLEMGVRGLALDLRDARLCEERTGDRMCFGHVFPHDSWIKPKIILDEIETFLQNNPNDIVTIILDNSVTDTSKQDRFYKMLQEVKDSHGKSYFFEKTHADFPQPKSQWPTVRQMVERNQRLIVFGEAELFPLLPRTDDYFSENMYAPLATNVNEEVRQRESVLKPELELENRPLSRNGRTLAFMNRFGNNLGKKANYGDSFRDHVYDFVWNNEGFFPNFVSLDYIKATKDSIRYPPDVHEKNWYGTGSTGWKFTGSADSPNTYDKFGFYHSTANGYQSHKEWLSDITVTNEPGYGIVKVEPCWSSTYEKRLTKVEIVTWRTYGIVNLRVFRADNSGDDGKWKTKNEKGGPGENGTRESHSLSAAYRMAYRSEGGHGIVDLSFWNT